MAKKKKTGKNKKSAAGSWKTGRLANFFKGDDFARIRGVFYMLLAAFLLLSLFSFFLSGQERDLNWMGALGHWCAQLLTKGTFGVASLGFSLIFVALCFYLFRRTGKNKRYEQGKAQELKKPVLPLFDTVLYSFVWMAWLSCVLGYVDVLVTDEGTDPHPALDNFAGQFGIAVCMLLTTAIGGFTPVLLAALAVVMLFFVHHVPLPKLPKRKEKPQGEEPEPDDDEAAPLESKKKPLLQRLFGKDPDEADEDEEEGEEFVPERPAIPIEEEAQEPEPEWKVADEKPADEVKFNIDEEFERINQQAQGGGQEPIFTVNFGEDPEPEEAPIPEEEEPVEDVMLEPLPEGDGEQHLIFKDGQLVDAATGLPVPPIDPHRELKDYQMPKLDLLEDWEQRNVKPTKDELVANKDRIVQTLRNYGIEITEISASPGPTVTLYEIKPAPGIRISKIKSLEDDIALSLAALGIRIIAPIPGKSAVGIEVPNAKPQIVSMKAMLESEQFQVKGAKMELPIALGKTISNEPYVTDLAKMPHLLMAGATGTGKSVGLNAIIASLLYSKHPADLKFVMVDPKKVELSLYSKIERHYLAKMPDSEEAIITDVKKVVRTLNSLCIEMDQRYDLLKMAQVRKITEYNDKYKRHLLNPENGHRYLPYIVLVIDEFADLIMTAGKEVEMPICRLAQLARAVGIHLIIATQRPTTNIITGTIKTNFPARIAFRVTSTIDSRTILDTGGANQLIGRGDMLISLAGSDMVRLQCALIETNEIERLGDAIGLQRGYPDGFLLPEYLDENEEPNKDFDPKQKDKMFDECARLVVASQFGSTSLLQRKLQLGYNRAGRIMDQLEAAGIVGAYNGSKAREVLVKDEVTLQEILDGLK